MRDKIEQLFTYRKVPYLLSFLKKKKATKLYNRLVKLQIAIYELDHYLETNWKLKNKELDRFWQNIYKCLSKMNYDSDEAFHLTNHIRRYQKHEMQLRESQMPTLLNKEYYYYYKSCDVRLIREIIYDKAPEISSHINLEDWRYFDLITEIDDDVEDVFEDQLTINGNMFLIMILEAGLDAAVDNFESFIYHITDKENNCASPQNSKIRKKLIKWTNKEATATLHRLKKNHKKLKNKRINKKMPLVDKNVLNTTF